MPFLRATQPQTSRAGNPGGSCDLPSRPADLLTSTSLACSHRDSDRSACRIPLGWQWLQVSLEAGLPASTCCQNTVQQSLVLTRSLNLLNNMARTPTQLKSVHTYPSVLVGGWICCSSQCRMQQRNRCPEASVRRCGGGYVVRLYRNHNHAHTLPPSVNKRECKALQPRSLTAGECLFHHLHGLSWDHLEVCM